MTVENLKQLWNGDDAVSSVEYAALLSLVCSGILAAILAMGDSMSARMESAAQAIRF